MKIINAILTYFFEPVPSGRFDYMYVLIILALLGMIISITLRIYLHRQKDDKIMRKLFRTLPGKAQTIALLLGLYVLVRYERMPYLSMRFLNYIILGSALYLIIRYCLIYLKVYPEEKKHHQQQLALNKYLPRKK